MSNREEVIASVYEDYLGQQSDISLVNIFCNAMGRLQDKDFMVDYFIRKQGLIQMITELDFTGNIDVSGFEDIRNEI